MSGRCAALGAVIALLTGACGGASAPSAPVSSPKGPTAPQQTQAEAIRLAPLPSQGLVIGRPAGVEFVDLNGRPIDRVAGLHLAYAWTVPGPVVLKRHRTYYLLDVAAHVLRPLESGDAAFRVAPQFQEGVDPIAGRYLDVVRPAGAPPDAGFWAYSLASPDGSTLLAQWSGECEVPLAFFLTAGGRDPAAVFGGPNSSDALESRGLGWTTDGLAVVQLMTGYCGSGGRPGVYLVRPGGSPRLLVRLSEPGAVRMWGTA